jgi:hypothetical protein
LISSGDAVDMMPISRVDKFKICSNGTILNLATGIVRTFCTGIANSGSHEFSHQKITGTHDDGNDGKVERETVSNQMKSWLGNCGMATLDCCLPFKKIVLLTTGPYHQF